MKKESKRAGRPVPRRKAAVPVTEAPAPGENLQEAESEIGINDWMDPETGEPAQGQSPPHLEAE
jgi:hypothetical protein